MRSHPAASSRVRRWPVADRELLILCKDTEHAARGVYESSCASAVTAIAMLTGCRAPSWSLATPRAAWRVRDALRTHTPEQPR